jgi:hypothetical protein
LPHCCLGKLHCLILSRHWPFLMPDVQNQGALLGPSTSHHDLCSNQ